jgi:hypothetical protein
MSCLNKKNRTYTIYLNNSNKYTGFTVDSLSPTALTGVFGHELGHITTYQNMNYFQIVIFGLKYANKNFRRKTESETDSIAISRGFGRELLEFNHFISSNKNVNIKYKQKKEKYYLNEEQIIKQKNKY